MPANLKNTAVATGLENVSFHSNPKEVQSLSHVRPFVTPWTAARQASLSITKSQSLFKLMSIEVVLPSNHLILCPPLFLPSIPKKGNAKQCSNYRTIALISHASKVMLKILQASLQQYITVNFQMFKLLLEKAERGTRDQIANICWIIEIAKSPENKSTSVLLIMPKPLIVWITINWKILKEMGIPDHLTYLLRNLYAGQEATVRTGHGTTNWFQIGKGIHQDYILSPYLFNFYAEYIMRNAWLEEVQVGIKMSGEMSITSDIQMTPPLWQKVKRN